MHGLNAADAVSAIIESDEPLVLLDLGELTALETESVLSEALAILPGTVLAFCTHSAAQADAALWQYDGIATLRPVDDITATEPIAYRYGAVLF